MGDQTHQTDAYIGLGSNIGDRVAYLTKSIDAIKELGDSIALSSVYRSDPLDVGYDRQSTYLNMVISIRTELTPRKLLRELLEIEFDNGRVRRRRNAPRTLDLDILMFGNAVFETEDLIVPHPRMHRRAFVMIPLAEIRPDLIHPKVNRPMSQIADDLPNQGVHRIGEIGKVTVSTAAMIPVSKPV